MKIWVTENNVVHHRKPRSVATVEYVQASELAEAVKVIEFYADESNYAFKLDERESIVTVIESEEGQLARDFLAKIGEQNDRD
jgi:hypothetical protein